MESELAQVQRALAVVENASLNIKDDFACRKAEEENSRLADERLALVMELGTIKDDFAFFREKVVVDRETMDAEFDASGDMLFNCGYGCYVFSHNICGSKPHIADGMPDPSVSLTPEFFANPHCPPSISLAAPVLDPAAVRKEGCLENSPTAAGEEVILPMGPPASSDGEVEDAIVN